MLQVTQVYSWQVRSSDCFAKIIDKTVLNEGTTGIPRAVMKDFYGRELSEGEEVHLDIIAGGSKLTSKVKRSQGRHRLFMNELRHYLRDNRVAIDDLLIFDRSLGKSSEFYLSVISSKNELLISPLDVEFLVGENYKTTSTRRIGQEAFREMLMRKYDARCCLSGIHDIQIKSLSLVKASHIKSWADSDPKEKVNVNNGLLLAPNYDALFDKHLISFNSNGTILTSPHITEEIYHSWSLGERKLDRLNDEMEFFMGYHRERLRT